MIFQFVYGGVDCYGVLLYFYICGGCISGFNGEVLLVDGVECVDLQGFVVLFGLVDGYIYLDKSFVGDCWYLYQLVNSLCEWLVVEKVVVVGVVLMVDCVEVLICQCSCFGIVVMCCYVDVDGSIGLCYFEVVCEVVWCCVDFMCIQLVVFLQVGVMFCLGIVVVLEQVFFVGVEVFGGIDLIMLDGDVEGQLVLLFGLVECYGVGLDIYLYEFGEIGLVQLLCIVVWIWVVGLQGWVVVSYVYLLGDVLLVCVLQVGEVLVMVGVVIMSNVLGDYLFLFLCVLYDVSVCVFVGNDNICDCWWLYGNGDLLQWVMLLGYCFGFYIDVDLMLVLDMVIIYVVQVIGLLQYGIVEGLLVMFVVVCVDYGLVVVVGVLVECKVVVDGCWLQIQVV